MSESRLTSRFPELIEHIKLTASGKRLRAPYKVERSQALNGYYRFSCESSVEYQVSLSHVCDEHLHIWEDYFFVDVGEHFFETVDGQKEGKEIAIKELIDTFEYWRNNKCSAEEAIEEEHQGGIKVVFRAFLKFLEAREKLDIQAMQKKSLNVETLELLLYCTPENLVLQERIVLLFNFLTSDYYKKLPYHDISSRVFAALRMKVFSGAYSSARTKERISGLFEDVKHISTYAPYVDAILVDNPMAEILSRPEVRLQDRYGTRVFSRNNLDELEAWLSEIHRSITEEHLACVRLAYPKL